MGYISLKMKRFCGFIAGFVFFLSGIVKLMDPVGAGLVMDEYFSFLHISFLSFSAKAAGVLFALAETVIGTALITGVWRKVTARCAIALQAFFTLLTLLLVIFNPEMDCGCFGEAIHLTHLQTFIKNIILLALLLAYYIPCAQLGDTLKKKYISFGLVTVSVLAFTIYSLIYIPLIDFTAYKPGAVLEAGAEVNTDEMYESVFTYFRGIPCLYYGSEIEFQKGEKIDVGPNAPLSTTGRAYFGEHLEGTVEANDFSDFTATGTVKETLEKPLSQHISKLNAIRRAVPALQKGQYTTSSTYVSGNMAYIRRFTDESTDSLACVTISGGATFKGLPNGRYVDAVTGDVQNVTSGTLTVPTIGKANMRVYVCCGEGFTGIDGAIGGTGTYLK